MTIEVDPEENETRTLFDLTDLRGRRVLEIGSGDGRLTWRYAGRAAHVTAIDSFAEGLTRAQDAIPADLSGRVAFHHIAFEDFAATTEPSAFDTAILSWSLC